MKFVFVTNCFESSALALKMKFFEGRDVRVIVRDPKSQQILDGIMDKDTDYVQHMGQGNIFIFDDASHGAEAESLRLKGELVLGGTPASDSWENDRGVGQKIMKQAGIHTVKSFNYKGEGAFAEAVKFVKANPARWVIKQNGENEKDLSCVGKFEDGQDVIDKLDDMKRLWVTNIDFDLMEFIDGHEVGVTAWFNGKDWLRDKNGEAVFEENWEHKKKSEGDTGVTTGETCTLSYRSTKESLLAKEMDKVKSYLAEIKYVGNTDINFMISKKDGLAYGLEFTNRFGYPYLNLQMETMETPWHKLIEGLVKGQNNFLQVNPRWAVVVVVQVSPFPFESTRERNNAKGQRIYFLKDGKWQGKDYFPYNVAKHVHFYEVQKNKENGEYECSGDTGYLMTVTGQATKDFDNWQDGIRDANDLALKRIKEGIWTSGMDFRKDCGVGQRITDGIKFMVEKGFL